MRTHNEGFSLVEIVVAMAILGLIVVPCGSALLMSVRLNERAQQMMQAQLAVSSAVETLMAEGIKSVSDNYDVEGDIDRFPDVTVKTTLKNAGDPYYNVIVEDTEKLVKIETTIRAKGGGSQ